MLWVTVKVKQTWKTKQQKIKKPLYSKPSHTYSDILRNHKKIFLQNPILYTKKTENLSRNTAYCKQTKNKNLRRTKNKKNYQETEHNVYRLKTRKPFKKQSILYTIKKTRKSRNRA